MSYEQVNFVFKLSMVLLFFGLGAAYIWISWIHPELYIRYLDWVFGNRRSYPHDRARILPIAILGLRAGAIIIIGAGVILLFFILSGK
jgi:hypothetical protein